MSIIAITIEIRALNVDDYGTLLMSCIDLWMMCCAAPFSSESSAALRFFWRSLVCKQLKAHLETQT